MLLRMLKLLVLARLLLLPTIPMDKKVLTKQFPKKARTGDAVPTTPDDSFLVDDSDVGQQAPKTPKLEETFKRNVNSVTSTDLDLYEHEDE